MSEEQQEQIKQFEKDNISIAAWCQQENKKIDKLINKEVERIWHYQINK